MSIDTFDLLCMIGAADVTRAQLAAHTDPSPDAQLRRYREAQALVKNPPKILLPWQPDHSGIRRREDVNGRLTASWAPTWAAIWVDDDDDVYFEVVEMADVDKALTAAGWQLCGGGE
tara:strand:- start:355 stop:705 length:351 start_codon:yes stop_codon:yes gene_type:complete